MLYMARLWPNMSGHKNDTQLMKKCHCRLFTAQSGHASLQIDGIWEALGLLKRHFFKKSEAEP